MSKEAEIATHQDEKRKRVHLLSPKPKLSPTVVYDKMFECNPNAAVFSVLPGFSHHMHTTEESQQETESLVEPTLPIPLHQLYEPRFQTLSDDELQELCLTTAKNIKVTNEEAEFLQKVTIGQSDCTAWHEHRKGRLTASHFHVVCRHVDAASQVYPKSIVKRIMQYYSSAQNVPALKWGRDNEDRARNEYIKFTKGKHNNLAVRPSGLVIHPNYPLLGASPDGFVCCDCCESRVLEIKCPCQYRATSPTADKPLSDPNFCLLKNAKGDVHLSLYHSQQPHAQTPFSVSIVLVNNLVVKNFSSLGIVSCDQVPMAFCSSWCIKATWIVSDIHLFTKLSHIRLFTKLSYIVSHI